jgi:Sulfotransferase family
MTWILGSPRSGSTWVLFLIAELDDVVPVNEPLIGWYLGPFLSDLPGFSAAELDADTFTLRQAQRDNANHFFADPFRHVWMPRLRAMMLARFREHVRMRPPRSGNRRRAHVLIKEPNGSQSSDLIMEALPRSRLLFLLRDGRDVVDSELAANREGSWVTKEFPGATGIGDAQRLAFVAQSARKWLWRTEITERAYEDHPGPKLLVRYEDLLEEPEIQLRGILGWMGVEAPDDVLARAIEKHAFANAPADQRGEKGFYRAAQPGLWRENLTAEEQRVATEIMGAKLRAVGYD